MTSDDLKALITEHLAEFYKRRLHKIHTLRLKDVLRRKNPYLLKAIGTDSATQIWEKLAQFNSGK